MKSYSQWFSVVGLICAVGCGPQPAVTSGNPTTASPNPQPQGTPTKPTEVSPPTPATPPVEEKFKVVIQDGKLSINGTAIPANPELTEVEKVLGKPTGIDGTKVNNLVYWKEHGVTVLQNKSSERVMSMTFNFNGYVNVQDQPQGNPFQGSVTINGEKVGKNSKTADLEAKLKVKESTRFNWSLKFTNTSTVYISGSEVYEVTFAW